MIKPTFAALMLHIIYLQWPCFTEVRSSSQFTALDDCTCQGYYSKYECTVYGGVATVWTGTAFDCTQSNNEVIIFHSNFARPQACNNGAIIGQGIRVENDTFISQLMIRTSDETNGSSIVCAHDTGNINGTPEIGSTLLHITTVPFPPPADVKLVEETHTYLRFNWSQTSSNCPLVYYQIVASNCGHCPNTTVNNTVTCTGNYTATYYHMSNRQCSFALQTVVCDDVTGDISIAVTTSFAEVLDSDYSSGSVMTEDELYTGSKVNNNNNILINIISASIASIIVLMGLTLVSGLVLVYVTKKMKPSRTKNENRQYTQGVNMIDSEVDISNAENNEQIQNSRTTAGVLYYADIGPKTIKASANCLPVEFSSGDRVEYEEIRYETGVPICKQPNINRITVNLDLLLILLQQELSPRWYQLGLVIGIPKDIMDGYVGRPSDQCLIEVLDYWLRHHSDQLTWGEVAQALREMQLYQLAEKAQQIFTTGKFPLETDTNFSHNQSGSINVPDGGTNESLSPVHPLKLGMTQHTSMLSEYDDSASPPPLPPPPLPPKGKNNIHKIFNIHNQCF